MISFFFICTECTLVQWIIVPAWINLVYDRNVLFHGLLSWEVTKIMPCLPGMTTHAIDRVVGMYMYTLVSERLLSYHFARPEKSKNPGLLVLQGPTVTCRRTGSSVHAFLAINGTSLPACSIRTVTTSLRC